jgi:hypothetical protein
MQPQNLDSLMNHNNPRLDTIRDFAAALGMSASDFIQPVTVAEYGDTLLPRV